MSKRPNGLGGVSFDRSNELWRARLTVDGRRMVRYCDNQAEAWKLLDAMRQRAAEGLDMRADRITVAEYLAAWLDDVAAVKVRPRTLEGYRQHVRDHLTPAIGAHTMAALSAGHVQRMIKAKAAAGLSAATVQRIHATLRMALADAERKGMIGRNPARFVDLPTVRRQPPEAMEPARAAAILAAVKGHRLEALITVAMLTGMRQGELLGLPWKAVDLVAGRLTVGQSLSRRTAAAPVLTEPKTKRSRRTLPLPPPAVAALQAHRERQRFEERAAGADWQNSAGLVFVARDGAPLDSSTAVAALRRSLAAAGLPPMRFHDLRHAYATLLIAIENNPRVVMELMGHSTIAVTMNLYGHVAEETARVATQRLGAAFGAATVTQPGSAQDQGGAGDLADE